MTATEFKARRLQLMDRVYQTGESIVITKRGEPISRLAPPTVQVLDMPPLFGCVEGLLDDLAELPQEYSVFTLARGTP